MSVFSNVKEQGKKRNVMQWIKKNYGLQSHYRHGTKKGKKIYIYKLKKNKIYARLELKVICAVGEQASNELLRMT
jgi:hypothetical protein